jgi:hypothetical protein
VHPHIFTAFQRELEKIAEGKTQQSSGAQRSGPKTPQDRTLGDALAEGSLVYGLGRYGGEPLGGGLNDLANRVTARSLSGHRTSEQEARIFQQHAPDVRVYTSMDDLIRDSGVSRLSPEAIKLKMEEGRAAFAAQMGNKRVAYVPPSAHPAVLAHELGHMTGYFGDKKFNELKRLGMRAQSLGPKAIIGLGTLGAGLAGVKNTPEEREKAYRGAQIAAGAGTLLHAPTLAEEARASIRAVNMGRKVGKGWEYARKLAPAFGTYAAMPVAVAGTTLGTLELLRRGAKAQAKAEAKKKRK